MRTWCVVLAVGCAGSGSEGGDDPPDPQGVDTSTAPPDTGTPPPEVDPRVGRTYEVSLGAATWVEPAGAGAALSGQSSGSLLVAVRSIGEDTVELRVGAGAGGAQKPCAPTADLVGAFADPDLVTSPAELMVELGYGLMVPLSETVVTASFAPDGDALEQVSLDGAFDSRRIAEAQPELGTAPDSFCQLLATWGDACGPCSDGEPYCVPVLLVLDVAPVAPDAELVPVTPEEVADDPACDG